MNLAPPTLDNYRLRSKNELARLTLFTRMTQDVILREAILRRKNHNTVQRKHTFF